MTMPKFEPVGYLDADGYYRYTNTSRRDIAPLYTADQLTEAYETGKQDQAAELEAARAEIERLKGNGDVQLGTNSNHAEPEQQRELAGTLEVGQLLGGSSHEATGNSKAERKLALIDDFRGGLDQLIASATALIELDIEGSLVPHGIGGHARALLFALCIRGHALHKQLAAEQAKNMWLRELVEHFALIDLGRDLLPGDFGLWVLRARKAIATPSDTSALEAIVKKAGEVMQKKCADASIDLYSERSTFEAIRALPAVTLEDLK